MSLSPNISVDPEPYVRSFDGKELRVLHTEQEVNSCLKNGWILFRVFTENSFIVVRA